MANDKVLTGEWQFKAELRVGDGVVQGEWDAIDGGDTTSATRRYRPGGALIAEVMPALPETGDITLERAYRGDFDGEIRKTLASQIGQPASITVHANDVNNKMVPGTSEHIRGVLKEVTRPAFRSESDGVALYRVVVAPRGNWNPAS